MVWRGLLADSIHTAPFIKCTFMTRKKERARSHLLSDVVASFFMIRHLTLWTLTASQPQLVSQWKMLCRGLGCKQVHLPCALPKLDETHLSPGKGSIAQKTPSLHVSICSGMENTKTEHVLSTHVTLMLSETQGTVPRQEKAAMLFPGEGFAITFVCYFFSLGEKASRNRIIGERLPWHPRVCQPCNTP
jgi:hypothetical protein